MGVDQYPVDGGMGGDAGGELGARSLLRRALGGKQGTEIGLAKFVAATRGGVEFEVAGREQRRGRAVVAAAERVQPGDQLVEREGLDQIIVGAGKLIFPTQNGHPIMQPCAAQIAPGFGSHS